MEESANGGIRDSPPLVCDVVYCCGDAEDKYGVSMKATSRRDGRKLSGTTPGASGVKTKGGAEYPLKRPISGKNCKPALAESIKVAGNRPSCRRAACWLR